MIFHVLFLVSSALRRRFTSIFLLLSPQSTQSVRFMAYCLRHSAPSPSNTRVQFRITSIHFCVNCDAALFFSHFRQCTRACDAGISIDAEYKKREKTHCVFPIHSLCSNHEGAGERARELTCVNLNLYSCASLGAGSADELAANIRVIEFCFSFFACVLSAVRFWWLHLLDPRLNRGDSILEC